jgi:hypothetical protein
MRSQRSGSSSRGEKNTEAFWRQTAQSGTPVIEPLEKDNELTLVTFLWRGSPETHNVVVFGSFTTKPMTEYVMTQLGGSDV